MKRLLIVAICLALGFTLSACGTLLNALNAEQKTTEDLPQNPLKDIFQPQNAADPQNADVDLASLFTTTFYGSVEFGSFPQTIAHHKAVAQMSLVTDATGYYYSEWDNKHYAKITKSKITGNRYKFSEDSLIEEGSTYYFLVEPIKWWVFVSVDTTGGTEEKITLIADMILDSSAFCANYARNEFTFEYMHKEENLTRIYANNWAYSDVRAWLNGDFLKKAFTEEEKKLLCIRDTSTVSSVYDEDDHEEFVWVPTAEEMLAYRLFFGNMPLEMQENFPSMTSVVTDYARCRNTFISIYPEYYGCGRYWTSSVGGSTYQAAYVPCDYHDDGGSGESVGAAYIGIRPVISMFKSDFLKLMQNSVA